MLAIESGLPNTLLNAASGTGYGSTFAVPRRPFGLAGTDKVATWQVNNDSGGSVTVALQGSLDNVNFFELNSFTGTTHYLAAVADLITVNFIRVYLSAISGGGTCTVLLSF